MMSECMLHTAPSGKPSWWLAIPCNVVSPAEPQMAMLDDCVAAVFVSRNQVDLFRLFD
jgi:hypothetical protein